MHPNVKPTLPVNAASHTSAVPDPVEDRHNSTVTKAATTPDHRHNAEERASCDTVPASPGAAVGYPLPACY